MNNKIQNQTLIGHCTYQTTTVSDSCGQENRLFAPDPENLNFGVWIWYSCENRLFLSESLSNMVGMPKGTLPTVELLSEYVCAADQDMFLKFWQALPDGNVPKTFSFRVYVADGLLRRIYCSVEVMAIKRNAAGVFSV